MSVLTANSFDFCNTEVSFEIEKCDSYNFFLLFQEFLGIQVLLQCHMSLRISFSISAKKAIEMLRLNLISRSF